jgi:tRNA1(Val) A37 N6-methylase TrmN6
VSAGPAEAADATHSVDAFLGGLVTLVQPRQGHRAGLDAALLQALVPADAAGCAIDLGTGVGSVAFAVAARAPALSVIGVEREPELVACARMALQLPENAGFAARVRLVEADVTGRRHPREAAGLPDHAADIVLMNPPFDDAREMRPSPDPRRRGAHVAEPGGLAAWCRTAAGLLKAGGTIGLIHRAAAFAEILQALSGRFGEIRVLPVHPAADRPAGRILVRARSASRGKLQFLPGLVLHRADGAWTPEADDILRGRIWLTPA